MGLGGLMAVLGGGFGLGIMIPPAQRAMGHVTNQAMPNEVLAFTDAVHARMRELMTQQQFMTELEKQGFDTTHQFWLQNLAVPLFNITEAINLFRRGRIDKELMYDLTSKQGWTEDSTDAMARLTEAIPGATDIIAFAVREVYSPEIAEAFGQFEGVGDVYKAAETDITAIGMTKDTFTKYWAAHWMLPSVGQGFEMVHRNVIPTEGKAGELDLDKLLTALDIMPAWRDKLTAISYSPYTRVDVRRMHKLGILKEEDLLRAYMDLGYDTEKATGMADFTIAYNYEPPDNELTAAEKAMLKERDLTKADVMSGYKDALIQEDEARAALKALGYGISEIDYYISQIDYSREKAETDDYLKYYHDAYVRGIMDFGEVTDKIGALNLPATRSERLFELWDLEKRAKTSRPTKAELMTFLRKKVITDEVWNSEMLSIGYSPKYIEWYKATV